MLRWNKDKERFETIKDKKVSRHQIMNEDAETAYRFLAGFAFLILVITTTMLIQSC